MSSSGNAITTSFIKGKEAEKQMKKVLCVVSNLRTNNGVASCMMNYFPFTNGDKFQMDFLCLDDTESEYVAYLKEHGFSYYVLPNGSDRKDSTNKKYIMNIIETGNYDIVHVNIVYYWALYILKCAKKCEVKHRILHAHNPRLTNNLSNKRRTLLFTELCNFYATDYVACTESAGKSVFGKRHFTVIHNAVEAQKYSFDKKARDKYRTQYDLKSKFVLGTSCRHIEQKNPFFLIDVFEDLHKIKPETVLLWVGLGPLKEQLEHYVEEKGLSNAVLFLGARSDMNLLYSAMDAFVLPSLFEGLGMVYIEAQFNGLYCFASDHVYKDTNVTGNITYLPIDKGTEPWVKAILECQYPRHDLLYASEIKNSGYDILSEKDSLKSFYESCLR